jgi:hypothetical protein
MVAARRPSCARAFGQSNAYTFVVARLGSSHARHTPNQDYDAHPVDRLDLEALGLVGTASDLRTSPASYPAGYARVPIDAPR